MSEPSATPSTAPAGVPPSGNAKYIVIVLLLLLGIGGLLIFRAGQKSPIDQPPIVSMFDAAPISHQEDFVPPPPPPEEAVPDSGQATRPMQASDPCAVKNCSGQVTSELENAIAFRGKLARRCYQDALANDSELHGRVGLRVRVASNGSVCSADIASNDLGNEAVAKCAANAYRTARSLPAPKGNCVDLAVPLNFVPGGK
ncbi:MAG TPA: AgmX/PglI C-terminal domain-containing protein [Polyangiaceae bacterium]|jgi:hypothetical protein